MNILMCINNGYVHPAINLMYSIRQYTECDIDLFILSTGLNDNSLNELQKKLEAISINVHTYISKDIDMELNIGNNHYSVDMFLRILSFGILPKNIEKILYLDADIIALDNIELLYNQNLGNKLLGVVEDIKGSSNKNAEYIKTINIQHKYFNSGVMLMNLSAIRKEWDIKKIKDYIFHNSSKYRYPDQDMLNVLCSNKQLQFLDIKFNYQIRHNESIDIDNVVILHYVDRLKPWNVFIIKPHEKLFWENYKLIKSKELYRIRKCFLKKRLIGKIRKVLHLK
ncbi:MAG: glycosyltransferase family 8 protein [Clostridia bacterium]|nr:glycosyltransferase family 8 protein [Clostridia bacterium]